MLLATACNQQINSGINPLNNVLCLDIIIINNNQDIQPRRPKIGLYAALINYNLLVLCKIRGVTLSRSFPSVDLHQVETNFRCPSNFPSVGIFFVISLFGFSNHIAHKLSFSLGVIISQTYLSVSNFSFFKVYQPRLNLLFFFHSFHN